MDRESRQIDFFAEASGDHYSDLNGQILKTAILPNVHYSDHYSW